MGKIGQIRVNDQIGTLNFFMDGDRLACVHKDKRYWIEDADIKDEYIGESSAKDQYIDSGLVGLEPGRKIWMPYSILKTRDVVRRARENDPMRKLFTKIYEQFENYGLVEFFMFGDAFLIWYEGEHVIIEDKLIKNTEQGIAIPATLKGIPVPCVYIPDEVLKTRDKIRAENEYSRRFKPIGETSEGIKFFLRDDDNLVIRYGNKEAIASEIENIYGKPAVKVGDVLNLGHPYLKLPIEVENAFRQARSKKLPVGLHMEHVGQSLLNGKQYYKLSDSIPEVTFNRINAYFEWFGDIGEMSGWLTSEPEKVEAALSLN